MTEPRFKLFQASEKDEERLKVLYAEKTRDGAIQLNLDRSPNLLDSLQVEGFENGVFAVEDTQNGVIAGAGIRNLRSCYLNGNTHNFGYLSGLRVGQLYRKSRAMALIFAKLRQLYMQGECSGYLCSIFNNNKQAISILTSGKGGMPIFKSIGEFNTFIFKPIIISHTAETNITVVQAQRSDISALVCFLNTEGAKRQYFPVYTESDFLQDSGLLKNLNISDIYLSKRNNQIIGCLALWDQTSFRRWKVDGYSKMLDFFRPFINLFLACFSMPQLPPKHDTFNYKQLSLVCICDNKAEVFVNLYNAAIQNIKSGKNLLISAGFFSQDSLIKLLPKRRITFKSTIFIGHWKETQFEIDHLDQRFPYLEPGSL